MTASPAAAMVRAFHEAFGLPIADKPALVDEVLAWQRQRLLVAEVAEVSEALAEGDLPGIAQELADVVYVAYGTALVYGIDLDAVLAEVHAANMTKLVDGGPVVIDGKVVKGPDYRKPDVAGVLATDQQEAPAPSPALAFADEDAAVHYARNDDPPQCGAPGDRTAECVASVTCRDCLDAFQTSPAPRGFRVGDLVEITGRDDEQVPDGLKLNGSVGPVSEIDDNSEYSIGVTVDGWVGLVWCSSTEIRHLSAGEVARLESGAGR